VNRTKIVKEITMHHQLMGKCRPISKVLLSRDQGSPDIVTEGPDRNSAQTALPMSFLAVVRQNNPQIQVDATFHSQAGCAVGVRETSGEAGL